MKQLGLYVHIPFCKKKCNYCDFLSCADSDKEAHHLYVDALIKEILNYEKGLPADTIFFGGGTPSLLDAAEIERILDVVLNRFKMADTPEISIEANPDTLSSEKLRSYIEMGVNRVSIGAQSLDDEILCYLGRIHTASDFKKVFAAARNAGFKNINVDLMFGIPGQGPASFRSGLEEVLFMGPEHVSFYSLQLEEGTPFHRMFTAGDLMPADDKEDRKMYKEALSILAERGYLHYEISNAALRNFPCRHNLKYWTMQEYLGFGLGSHSYKGGCRFGNVIDMNAYLENQRPCWHHKNSMKDEISEYLITGLRLTEGINCDEFRRRFGISLWGIYEAEIRKHIEGQLLQYDKVKKRLRFTRKGIDLSNLVLMEFV